MTEPHRVEGVGEVYGADRDFVFRGPIPGLTGDHICGTQEEHERGELLDVTRPPNTYLPSGVPACCAPARREAVVPVTASVVSTAITSNPYRSSISTRVLIEDRVIRSGVNRSRVCVCPAAIYAQAVTLHPYRSTVHVAAAPVSDTARLDPYRSVVRVAVGVESPAPAPGFWARYIGGDYAFTATYTGPHRIRCIGAGADGGIGFPDPMMTLGGGGGGGGASAESVVDLTAGVTYLVHVGGVGGAAPVPADASGIYLVDVPIVQAEGGFGPSFSTGGLGGRDSESIGTWRWSGGRGADGELGSFGGGGGGAAGWTRESMPPGVGEDASGAAGGAGFPEGGDGGGGGPAGEPGLPGQSVGGGGGGAGDLSGVPGDGADGCVVIDWPWTE